MLPSGSARVHSPAPGRCNDPGIASPNIRVKDKSLLMSETARTPYFLPTGRLDLRIHRHFETPDMPEDLFRIAARQNPKRGFLFVSTVLGRHIPVRPSLHRAALRQLAQRCLTYLTEGPVLVMGFAETAIGLGAGVAEEIARHHKGTAFLPTTRHPVPGRGWLGFSEPHSHASAHEILLPPPHPAWAGDHPDRTLVLVDDEMTTGTTIVNLVSALQSAGLAFARVLLVTLTDWSEGRAAALLRSRAGLTDVHSLSLMQGDWCWAQDETRPPDTIPQLEDPSPIAAWIPAPDTPFAAPRLGITGFDAPPLPDLPALASFQPDQRVLVIGSGEHVWQPFRLAEGIEELGCEIAFCATTRSPIHLGETIASKITFPDHFGLGIPMYLHNVTRSAWDRVILMTETGPEGIADCLRQALSPFELVDGQGRIHQIGYAA